MPSRLTRHGPKGGPTQEFMRLGPGGEDALDLDGKVLWSQRGFGQGSVAGKRLVIMSSRGDCGIVEAKPTEEQRARTPHHRRWRRLLGCAGRVRQALPRAQ